MSEQQSLDLADAITVPEAVAEWPGETVSRVRYLALKYPQIVMRQPQLGWPLILSRRLLSERLSTRRPYHFRERPPPEPQTADGEGGHAAE